MSNTLHVSVRRNLPRNDWRWTATANRLGATHWREYEFIGCAQGDTREQALDNLSRFLNEHPKS